MPFNSSRSVAEPFGLAMTYSYDAASNRTTVQDNQGGRETFTYDAAERLTNVKFTGNSATASYDLAWTDRDQLHGQRQWHRTWPDQLRRLRQDRLRHDRRQRRPPQVHRPRMGQRFGPAVQPRPILRPDDW